MEQLGLGLLGALDQFLRVVRFVWRPCNYLCCFTCNIDDLKDETQSLDDAVEGLEREVAIARDNIEDPIPEVETWVIESKKIQDEIIGILSEVKDVENGCSKLGARFLLSRRAKIKTESTKEHRDRKPEAKFLPRPNAATQGVQLEKAFECESRNKIEEEIMTTLSGGDVNMIGIWGMGGLGKTTMARKIMKKALDESVLKEAVIVSVGQEVNILNIQDEIGVQLGLEKLKDEKHPTKRKQILRSRLDDRKRRTVVVLDDVWNKPPLESIGIPIDSNTDVCTILFTSRNADVLRVTGVQKICGMKVLSEEEAWIFFAKKAGTCVDDREVNPIAKQVAKECGGLPINLAAVGVVLRDEGNAAIWEHTLTQLKENVPDNVQYDENYTPLEWSYDRLDSEEAKSIFLLCCLFPEDANIPMDYLSHFCMGLRIFEEDITNKKAWNWVCKETKKLKDRSLLLDSDKKDFVRMHDVVRDVCTSIAKRKGCTWISSSLRVGQRNAFLSGSRRHNLNLLFLNSRYDSSGFEFDDAFLEGMRELHVLCIEDYSSLTRLPHPTQSLGKLNTLILDKCHQLKTISVVGELVNLEIFICRNCYLIEELPTQMKGLNRLKLLELMECTGLKSIGRGIISSLIGLEELKMHGSFKRWEAEGREERENARLRELEALPNLTCLEIEIDDPSLVSENMPRLSKKIVRFVIRIGGYSSLPSKFSKAMRLCKLKRETRLGDWIEMQFLRDTEYLRLSGDGANNVDLAKIQNIRWLELEECKSMKNVVRTSGGDDATVLSSIEHLELDSLPELQEICDSPISSTSFQNLKELELTGLKALTQLWKSGRYVPHFSNLSSITIWSCHSLHNLDQLSMAGKDCLPQLQELKILFCNLMERVFLWSGEEAGENITNIESHVITKMFPKLKEVGLYNLPNLTIFYQGIQGIEFPLLREMTISECPKMKSIMESSSAEIDEDDSWHLLCQPQKVSFGSSLEVLVISHNPFCGHQIHSSLFNGLKDLTITKYVGSLRLFTLSVAAKLVNLNELCIIECGKMIKVIEDEEQQERILLFPKLEKLELKNLPKLVSFCESKCEVELPLLRKVEIEKCPNMTNFSLGLIATPHMEALTTDLTTYVGVGVDVAFNRLKELEIFENENPWYDDKILVSLLNGLEKLKFTQYNISTGMSLFPPSAVGNLVNLRVLEIEKCDEMLVKVIEDEKVVSGGEIRSSVVFPKLEELYLCELPKLVSFCEWKCDVELPSLRKVHIYECPNMKNFSMGVATPNLKIVQINSTEISGTVDLNGMLQHYFARQEKGDQLFEEIRSEEKDEIEEEKHVFNI